jgi:hypothetical protein
MEREGVTSSLTIAMLFKIGSAKCLPGLPCPGLKQAHLSPGSGHDHYIAISPVLRIRFFAGQRTFKGEGVEM